jgi:hypothetical protein
LFVFCKITLRKRRVLKPGIKVKFGGLLVYAEK